MSHLQLHDAGKSAGGMRKTLTGLLVGSLLSLGSGGVVHAESASATSEAQPEAPVLIDASELVRSMASAMKTLNYEGTFVHVQGSNIKTMNILHSSDANGELERLRALDGEAREVYRNHNLVTCIWPASESVIISKARPRELLPKVDALLSDNDRYRFSLGKSDRVAGMPTHVVTVEPADSHRYGYRFWIDKQNYMLLRSMLLDGKRVVEQVMFTLIEYPISIDPMRFDVSQEQKQISWLEPKKLQATSGLPEDLQEQQVDRITFSELPMGYREVSETYSTMPINDGPVSHVMLSDGMASVSVYVEYDYVQGQSQGVAGLSSMGAMNAFGLHLGDEFITAVGEVPSSTVESIAKAVRIR